MCGYFGNLHECPAVVDLLNQLNIPLPYPEGHRHLMRKVPGLIIQEGDSYHTYDAIWWYLLKNEGNKHVPNQDVTSFNARNLTSPMWKKAISQRRGIVFATEIGESQGKKKYLMRAEAGLALGCVYQHWQSENGVTTSMAVITRNPHERFSRYHKKSIPCFLPLDVDFIREWLNPSVQTSQAIQEVLENPRIYTDLDVMEVKTYKSADAQGKPELLVAD